MTGHMAGTGLAELVASPFPAGDGREYMASRPIRAISLLVALAAIGGPALLVAFGPAVAPAARHVAIRRPAPRTVSSTELPQVEPLAIEELDPDDARAFNAGVPFSTSPNPPARPLRLATTGDDAVRAIDCLAAAVYYEAGDDAIGERAVAQVVVNRLRHPAFPKTVCGVVFQGSERTTGCQFTFTCDGSIARRQPAVPAWTRAREIATAALHGSVYRPVGWSTHYHADFVVPYWQASLDKLAEVHTQLFYRWSGWWGTAGAFRGRPQSAEPLVARLAELSEAHRAAEAAAVGTGDGSTKPAETPALGGRMVEEGDFLVALPAGAPGDGFPLLAAQACGERRFCRYLAWRDGRTVPAGLPLSAAEIATLSFSYVRDRSSGYDRSSWNCREIVRRDTRECMRAPALPSAAAVVPVSPAAGAAAPGAPTELTGIRRHLTDPPTAKPTDPAPSPHRD